MPSGSPSSRLLHFTNCLWVKSVFAVTTLIVVLGLGSIACAGRIAPTALEATRDVLAGLDDFGALLLGAGLSPDAIPTGAEISPTVARRLIIQLGILPSVPQHYAPRVVATLLLRAVEGQNTTATRRDLSLRVQSYRDRFVLQPDGYLAAALTGKPVMCVGPVEVDDDGARAGAFRLGMFYINNNGSYYTTDDPFFADR
jgi:hypothetical protein